MGQRLNLEIKSGDETLANAYFHWDAYTKTSLAHAQRVIQYLNKNDNGDKDKKLLAINTLEAQGARLTTVELGKLPSEYDNLIDNTPADSRNEGLIAISPEGMEETQSWAEGSVIVHLDTRTVDFDVMFSHSKEEHAEWSEDYEKAYKDLPRASFNFDDIPFEKFAQFAVDLDEHHDHFVNTKDGNVYSWIE